MKNYHHVGKKSGPGGIRCACCNPYHSGRSQASTKKAINRCFRRKVKQENLFADLV